MFHSLILPQLWKSPEIHNEKTLVRFISAINSPKRESWKYIHSILFRLCFLTDEDFLAILPKLANVKELALWDASKLTDQSITEISHYCKQLKRFWLEDATLTHQSPLSLGQCQQLEEISFVSCRELTSRTLQPFVHLPIKSLSIRICNWLDAEGTAKDLRLFHHLEELNIQLCNAPLNDFFRYIAADDAGVPYLPLLQSIFLLIDFLAWEVSESAILPFLKSHTALRDVTLFHCTLTSKTFEVIAHHLPDLEFLLISNCLDVSAQAVRDVVNHCPKLYSLELVTCKYTKDDFPELGYCGSLSKIKWDIIDLNRIRAIFQQLNSTARQLFSTSATTEKATFAAGCFWGVEHIYNKHFQQFGIQTKVGYTGGHTLNPDYRSVCSGTTHHAEAVEIDFDPEKISFDILVEFFYKMHDPTTEDSQGPDIGTEYRSAIFYHSPEQKSIAQRVTAEVQEKHYKGNKIVTEIVPASIFYSAESYHQHYLTKHPGGYQCPTHFLRW
ncbi:hypothetical protein G6F56_000511 [Rhizopus delemar]|nr:hypothetical protein G6F56_000511 [Rhizopus delemar]